MRADKGAKIHISLSVKIQYKQSYNFTRYLCVYVNNVVVQSQEIINSQSGAICDYNFEIDIINTNGYYNIKLYMQNLSVGQTKHIYSKIKAHGDNVVF